MEIRNPNVNKVRRGDTHVLAPFEEIAHARGPSYAAHVLDRLDRSEGGTARLLDFARRPGSAAKIRFVMQDVENNRALSTPEAGPVRRRVLDRLRAALGVALAARCDRFGDLPDGSDVRDESTP